MKARIGLAAALALGLLGAAAAAPAVEKTVYTILLGGAKAGTEELEREFLEGGAVRELARVRFKTGAGLTVSIDTVLTLKQEQEALRPALYSLEGKTGEAPLSVKLAWEGGRLRGTVRQGERERKIDVEVPAHAAVLENNVIHPYRSLYRRYNFDARGAQKVPVVVPSAGLVAEATLEHQGTVKINRAGKAESLERVTMTVDAMSVDLYGTRGGKFLLLTSEEQGLTAAVSGYEEVEILGE